MLRPVTVAVVVVPLTVAVSPPGEDVTVYPVMEAPPLDEGAVQLTVACVFPAVARALVGAPGGPAGVTLLEGEEAGPDPRALAAVTVNVYAVPLVSPVTVAEVVLPFTFAVRPPGEEVAV